MTYLKIIAAVLVALALGYGIGRYLQPAEIKTEVREVEKVVEKIKKDIVIVERETKSPDGTVVIDRRTEDRSEEAVSRDTRKDEKSEITAYKPQWRVSALAKAKLDAIIPQYGAHVDRRILGPVWLGVGAYQDGTAQVSVGWEF